MKISFTGVANREEFHSQNAGYGRVARQIYDSLQRHGYEVAINDFSAPVNICCENPGLLYRSPGQYNIGISTHESTELASGWPEGLRSMDEVWTTATWTKNECFDRYVDNTSLVVRACISNPFQLVKRSVDDVFYFIHTGEPTPRKNGRLVLEAFEQEFANEENVHLIFKSSGPNSIPNINFYDRVINLEGSLDDEEYAAILSNVHCLVYPSMGEGGGMMPLECMATGMPSIVVPNWADYSEYIHLKLDSTLGPVPEEIERSSFLRGQVYLTTVQEVRKQMREVYSNYSDYQKLYEEQAEQLVQEYNWDREVETRVIPRLEVVEKKIK